MIENFTLDENVKSKRNRGIRRKNNYVKAKKFQREMISIFGPTWWEDMPLGRFVKNTSLNEAAGFRGWYKTKNKGPNHNGTYAPTHNYTHKDLKRKESMDWDQANYEKDIAWSFFN